MSTIEGPTLEYLTARLADCPPDFLLSPYVGKPEGWGTEPQVVTSAVFADLLLDLGGRPLGDAELAPVSMETDTERLKIILIGCWLFHDSGFRSARRYAPAVYATILRIGKLLAHHVETGSLVTDPERREEFVRLCLRGLGLRPLGETEAHAEDRLRAVSTLERERVVAETRKKLEKARELAEALRKKEAEEAAARAYRE